MKGGKKRKSAGGGGSGTPAPAGAAVAGPAATAAAAAAGGEPVLPPPKRIKQRWRKEETPAERVERKAAQRKAKGEAGAAAYRAKITPAAEPDAEGAAEDAAEGAAAAPADGTGAEAADGAGAVAAEDAEEAALPAPKPLGSAALRRQQAAARREARSQARKAGFAGGTSIFVKNTADGAGAADGDAAEEEDEEDEDGMIGGERAAATGGGAGAAAGSVSDITSRSVYAGGLPFSYDEAAVRACFSSCGRVKALELKTFPDSGRFRGIAIVELATSAAAAAALKLDGQQIDGCYLAVRPASQGPRRAAAAKGEYEAPPAKAPGCLDAYVGNLAYDIDEEALTAALGGYPLRDIRWGTDKSTGEFRGYAIVAFADDAALEAAVGMNGSRVRGRELRVAYATPRRTAPGVRDGAGGGETAGRGGGRGGGRGRPGGGGSA